MQPVSRGQARVAGAHRAVCMGDREASCLAACARRRTRAAVAGARVGPTAHVRRVVGVRVGLRNRSAASARSSTRAPATRRVQPGGPACGERLRDQHPRLLGSLRPRARQPLQDYNCSACANASAAGCMCSPRAAGGNGACVEANSRRPRVGDVQRRRRASPAATGRCRRTARAARSTPPSRSAPTTRARATAPRPAAGDGGCVWCGRARVRRGGPRRRQRPAWWARNSNDQKVCAERAGLCRDAVGADFCYADDRCGDAACAGVRRQGPAAGPSSAAVGTCSARRAPHVTRHAPRRASWCEAPQLNATAMLAAFASLGAQCTTKVGRAPTTGAHTFRSRRAAGAAPAAMHGDGGGRAAERMRRHPAGARRSAAACRSAAGRARRASTVATRAARDCCCRRPAAAAAGPPPPPPPPPPTTPPPPPPSSPPPPPPPPSPLPSPPPPPPVPPPPGGCR